MFARTSTTTPAVGVALRRILPVVLSVGVVAALMGGGFVLFGMGGLLARGTPTAPLTPAPPG